MEPAMIAESIETPQCIARLPQARGFHIPWFVPWIDGKPEFRVADGKKFQLAIMDRLCWICGDSLGRYLTYVAGPMCGINRVSAEPPSHLECARYAAKVCPFLSRPDFERREAGIPEGTTCAGVQIKRNPGVVLLWTTREFKPFSDGNGGILFNLGAHDSHEWYAEGRTATRAEVKASVVSGLPLLLNSAKQDGPDAVRLLGKMMSEFEPYYPGA
jgi:hypothetical protein